MKKALKMITITFLLLILIFLLALFCSKKTSLGRTITNYPIKMVVTFLKEGIVKAKDYDKGNLKYLSYNEKNKISYEDKIFTNPICQADSQFHNECGGMSSSYVMRFYNPEDKNISGLSVYSQIENKNPDGTINPNQLYKYWKTQTDYEVYVCKGTIENLKEVVSYNIPVIVLINCSGGFHYIPVIGYDSQYIFIQDSVPAFRNSTGTEYNRKETYKDFENLWNVSLPKCDHLMYIVTKKDNAE